MAATPEQLHLALTYCSDFAKTMLEDSGGFHPFGAIVKVDGDVEARGGWTGQEYPSGQDVYGLLIEALRSGAIRGGSS